MARSRRELLGYCGEYCGDCFAHEGTLADLARDLRGEFRAARFADTAALLSRVPRFKVFAAYPQCYDMLGALVRFRCKRACRGGGGNPKCAIRLCCVRKDLAGCWECGEFEDCSKLCAPEPDRGEAVIRKLRVIKRRGVAAFIDGRRHRGGKAAT